MGEGAARSIEDPARLAALLRSGLMDSPREEAFDRITRIASMALRAPISLISAVGADRQFFKSSLGLPEPWALARGTPLVLSFCRHVVARGAGLCIEDTSLDRDFRDNPLVEQLQAAAYLGEPLRSPDGQILGTLCVVEHVPRRWSDADRALLLDLTGLVSTEVALRWHRAMATRADQAVSQILESVSDAFVYLDNDFRYTYVNGEAGRLFGRDPKQLLGKHIWTEFPKGKGHKFHLAYEKAIREQAPSVLEEYYPPWSRWYENRIYPSPDGVAIFFHDVTARKQAELALEASREQLRGSQRREEIGRLAGGLAHDFNNMLAVVRLGIGAALESLGAGAPVPEGLTDAREAAEKAEVLTRQLLALGRQQAYQPRDLDLNEAVRKLEPLLRRAIGGAGISLEVRLADALPHIHADPAHVEQVLLNLMVNARDAVGGRGHVIISTETGTAAPGGPLGARCAVLTVRDDGQGMDEATQAQIFEPYFSTKDASSGSGLGLAIVQGLVAQAGGRISVVSSPGAGAIFRLELPTASAAPGAAPQPT